MDRDTDVVYTAECSTFDLYRTNPGENDMPYAREISLSGSFDVESLA